VVAAVSVLTAAYFIGSIPFAILLVRWRSGLDVRRVGSGNPGAANVWRSTGPAAGLMVLVLDCAKGALAVLIARRVGLATEWQAGAALAVMTGHVWPVWLRFRGGKGVAAATGAFGALVPMALGAAIIMFAIVVGITRYVSLGSIVAAIALVVATAVLREPISVIAAAGVAAVVIVMRHHENIRRLRRGTEPRLRLREMK
jgi:acyl phosphate:glycerol-3-phosphate acyltransferase